MFCEAGRLQGECLWFLGSHGCPGEVQPNILLQDGSAILPVKQIATVIFKAPSDNRG
jgi:hypothetical protein